MNATIREGATPPAIHYERPSFSRGAAEALAGERFGVRGTASALPSERDQNFLLTREDGARFVLKIAMAAEERGTLELQNGALEHLALRVPGVALPRVVRSVSGSAIEEIVGHGDAAEAVHLLRLLTYVSGRVLAEVRPHSAGLLRSLGRVLGEIDAGLRSFSHPAAQRPLKWDLARAAWIGEHLDAIEDPKRRALVERALRRFEGDVLPRWGELRQGVVYNDANDHNVLVASDPSHPRESRVVGVVDFGDMVETATIGDLAIGCAYALMGKPDPLGAAAAIVAGYQAALPLAELEVELLFPLIAMRLAVSATNAAIQRAADPQNAYLTISESGAWETLARLDAIHSGFAGYRLRASCGWEPVPHAGRVVAWLGARTASFGPLVRPDSRAVRTIVFDHSIGSPELGAPPEWEDVEGFTRKLFGRMREAGAVAGIGRYDEARTFYTSAIFQVPGNDGPRWRTVHIGLDLYMEAGTEVCAPLAGVLHARRDNCGPRDYGPTLILRHEIEPGLTFYTLYGHLSRPALELHEVGDRVEAGEVIGWLGDIAVNGGWTPHLHIQIVTDLLDREGDFPGVALPEERETWLSLSPDPCWIAGPLAPPASAGARPGASEGRAVAAPKDPSSAAEIPPPSSLATERALALRRARVGPSLRLSYFRALHIVRGFGAYLYDAEGRAYLDTVNNVCHVGHCHPRVVAAGAAQMALLNTNTRYLHEHLGRFAERLAATLPEPLRVVYFVNSGSEANELALRLARTRSGGAKGTVVLDAGYHGNSGGLIEVSPYKHDGPGGGGPPPFVRKVPLPDAYRGIYRGPGSDVGRRYAVHVGEAIRELASGGERVSAFLHESIVSCGGQVVLPEGFLAEAYAAVRAAGGLCIADEVQTGLGRVGERFWAFELHGVVPDVVTIGKPIGNGHPLAAVVTTPEIAADFANGMEYFNTFGGNPVSCAIGLSVLDVIRDEGLQERALRVGDHLKEGFRQLAKRHSLIGDVRGHGLFLGVELVRDGEGRDPAGEEATYIADRMRERGVLMSTDGPDHNVLKIKPPLAFGAADADLLLANLETVLGEDFIVR
jgi:4-aminobutyrate aminotransferase-like enzyme/Ser/Thr protein kinase RdoA (MazF antagonist)